MNHVANLTDNKKLSELTEGMIEVSEELDVEISGITLDSRRVSPGCLFIAFHGEQQDGREFIAQAIEDGAVAVLCEATSQDFTEPAMVTSQTHSVSIFSVMNLADKIGLLASRFYQHPSEQLLTVAVTGTNGKTSICHYLAQAIEKLGQRCAVVGTAGTGFLGQLQKSELTTPDASGFQQILAQLKQQGAQAVCFEASSHGLQQGRVNATQIDTAIFTNLTLEHLDYHGDMQHYGQAKCVLFQMPGLKRAVINADDEFGLELINEFKDKLEVVAYSCQAKKPQLDVPCLHASAIEFSAHGLTAKIETPWGEGDLTSQLLGKFNLSNLLAALACLGMMRVPLSQALPALEKVEGALGRMQVLTAEDKPCVVIDFAHTVDALEQALLALRQHYRGRLVCVFGCGGSRAKDKRALMGAVAAKYCDEIILTNDNPRYEKPEEIVESILSGMQNYQQVSVELDRKIAITQAITQASCDDVILIAGKGHEDYQLFAGEKRDFSDHAVVNALFASGEAHD